MEGGEEEQQQKRDDSRFNQTLENNVQGFLKGRSVPGEAFLTRSPDPPISPTSYHRSFSEEDAGRNDHLENPLEEVEDQSSSHKHDNTYAGKLRSSSSGEMMVKQVQNVNTGVRSSDHGRVMKFNKVLSDTTVILEKLRELAWNGVPHYMRPDVWRLLLGYAPPNSDRREAVLRRKRLEYLESVGQFYDLPDSERSDDEINMLRQIALDCPRTVPDVSFFQQAQVQKSLERILYTWAIRHPASGYVQGINDLVTPFLVIFLSEYLEGGVESWSMSDLSSERISDVEADCYWCLTKLLDGMQDHYTFAQPGIQRLVFKLKELVRRIDEPVARHMEEQGVEFLQFAFRWYNCLLIREIPYSIINRLWDTYLAEGDALPDFLVYIYASFLLTWSDELKKLDFQEMVMFLQHLPTHTWTDQELEMVLSRAFMWHSYLVHGFLLFIIWLSSFQEVASQYKFNDHSSKTTTFELANPPGTGVSGPIQVSPSVIPKYESPPLPWTPPMYPTFPDTYQPKLTGKCPADFQAISAVIDTAASDCSQPFAALVGNVICCPQFVSLLHIFQGQHNLKKSEKLVVPDSVAADCFSDLVSILVSKRANMTIPELCSVTSSNLTGGSCPVQDVAGFEKAVNGSRLLDACRTVDPLKECCRPVCQGAIMEAALAISSGGSNNNVNALNDCKNVVFSYVSRKLPADKANAAFRILSSCKVNKACPLEFKEPTEVVKACRNAAAPSPSCSYGMQQGCLLRSYPADLIFDNTTGYSFTCDLTDNIAAPWPSSASVSSLSLCAPEMSLPALPTSQQTHINHGAFLSKLALVPIVKKQVRNQLVTACPVGMLLKGEVMGSRPTNNLIMELERTHNGGVGVGALQRCEPRVHGRVVPRGGLSKAEWCGQVLDAKDSFVMKSLDVMSIVEENKVSVNNVAEEMSMLRYPTPIMKKRMWIMETGPATEEHCGKQEHVDNHGETEHLTSNIAGSVIETHSSEEEHGDDHGEAEPLTKIWLFAMEMRSGEWCGVVRS
ncbi:hypothetical protein HID58_009583 [Brassica napus]|uniref:Rab-GAP TBC domain-containing protein n=1 Tax=Brassica napus TaxID=3708 RepID=A0ABQ8DVH4_BRANA|nr:hypothetical protein HID58_009583 [Brassica napus]